LIVLNILKVLQNAVDISGPRLGNSSANSPNRIRQHSFRATMVNSQHANLASIDDLQIKRLFTAE